MGKDYAGESRKQAHVYEELVITDMKEEPYTPTEVVDNLADDSQCIPYHKTIYTEAPTAGASEVTVENGRSIYVQSDELDKMERHIIDIIKQLHITQETVMIGDIISSHLDVVSDQLEHPLEMEHQAAIIYHIIDVNTRPGGKLKANASTSDDPRPEQRQISISESV